MSLAARYVWAYLPCHADREGRLRDSSFFLRSQIFPGEAIDMEAVLRELSEARHIIRYKADGRSYIQIRSFARHQSPHKNEKTSDIPPPNEGLAELPEDAGGCLECVVSEPTKLGNARSCSDPDPVSPLPILSSQDQTRAESGNAKSWTAAQWQTKFGERWCAKYGGLAMGGGLGAARATGELSEQLAALPLADRLAAQGRSSAMFTDYLGSEKPDVVEARHPWAWFVTRFDGLRMPKLAVAPAKVTESFAQIADRTRREVAERTRASLHRDVAQTAETLTTCPVHLYGPREDRKCNKRCPMWEGAPIPSDPIRTIAESKGAAHG